MRFLAATFLVTTILIGFSFKNISSSEINLTEVMMPDTTILPKTDSIYPVKILKPGIYDVKDINYDATTMVWFALVGNGVTYAIKKISPEQEKITNEHGVENWQIKGDDSLNTIMMFSGVELLEKEVIEMKLGIRTFKVGDRLELNYNGKKFVVLADGEELKDKKIKKNYISRYQLYIAPLKKEKNRSLISFHKRVDEIYPKILFMGDLDNDKKPDLIIDNTNSDKEHHVTLYLTNNAPKGNMFKVMGVFNYTEE